MSKRKKLGFSVTKAVKSNARDRIGTPPPAQVLPDEKTKAAHRASKHRMTLDRLLENAEREPGGATRKTPLTADLSGERG